MGINVDHSRAKQDKGVWTNFGGSSFLVANTGSIKFQRALTRLQAPHRKKIERGTLDPAISRDILCQAMSEGLVLDWKNVGNAEGADVPFSEEVCAKALKNNDDLREYLQEFAMDLENFRTDELKAEGNS